MINVLSRFVRIALAVLALTFGPMPYVLAQSCSAWYTDNPNVNGSSGPFSTPAQTCAAQGYTQIGSDTETTDIVALGAPAPGTSTPPSAYACNQTVTISGTPAWCAEVGRCGIYYTAGGLGADLIPDCTNSYYVQANQSRAQVCSGNCPADPINPAVGNVFKTETDVSFAGSSPITYQRFYNSADSSGADGVPGWRHSYDRYITTLLGPAAQPLPTVEVSPQYTTAAQACTSGFTTIQSAVSAWAGATASYANNICTLSNSTGAFATLPIYSVYQSQATSTATEYDVTRDDGQLLRYPVVNGVITNPPGISIRLALTASGFTLTDDDDNVETYNSTGALQSISSRSGVVQTIAYDSNGLFLSATDSFGNSLTVARNTIANISQITLSGGGTVKYAYDPYNNLATVTNLDNTTLSYQYGNATFPNALTAEIDENGTTYSTWAYNGQEQATATQEAGGAGASTLTYNPDGSVSWTDALGAERTFSYTRIGDINQVTGISGSQCPTCEESAATTYDAYGWVSSRTDYNGNLTCYANDPVRGLELVRVEGFAPGSTCPGNLSTYTPTAGTVQRMITTVWSPTWREPSLITEPNRTTGYTFDGSGNIHTKTVTDLTVTPNATRVWTYSYNSLGQALTVQSPRTDLNSTTTYTYWPCTTGGECGQVETIQNAVGQVTTFNTYNAYGQPLTITDPNGVVATLSYDARERLTSYSVATGPSTAETTGYQYYPTGLLNIVTLPDGTQITYGYDAAHRLTDITDSLGNHIHYVLDALGNHTADDVYDPTNTLRRTHTRVFNTLSQLYQDINAAGTEAVTTTLTYDPQGNLQTADAPLGRNTANYYDALNRLDQITDPNLGQTYLGYDANDNLNTVKDPNGYTTTYTHNGFGDLTTLQSPDTGTTQNTFDSAGNLKTATDARGDEVIYTLDALNRVTQQAYNDETIVFGYDNPAAGVNGIGRLTSASDANHSLSWTYDTLGRVKGKGQSVAGTTLSVGYSYNNGDLVTLVTPSSQHITYSYTNHQITGISINGSSLLSGVTYFPYGAVSGWTWSNGATVSRTYDEDGKIASITTASDTLTFGYDNAFRITSITDANASANSWSLPTYDLLDRLQSASNASTTYGWTYDANGNRLTQTGTTAITLTSSTTSNELKKTTGGLARTYTYDAAGNTKSYAALSFTYDDRGTLAGASNGGTSASYIYDALGQLIEKAGSSSTTVLMYDEQGHLLGEYSSGGTLIQETIWMGDIPVATLRPNGSTGCTTTTVCVFNVHTDQLNAPRKVTKPATGQILWRWDTDPFGTVTPNQNPSGVGSFVYNLRFPGQYYQADTGVFDNHFRHYDPQTGRYIESDPIGLMGGSYSTYAYTAGNPVNNVDPQGTLLQVAYSNGGTEAQLSIALAYLAGSSQYIGDLAQLIASPYLYTLNVDPNGTDSYAYQNRTITWNPTSGLNITGVGIQSPAIALAHETHHAECHQSLGTKAFRASQRVPSQTVINDDGITVLLGISADERNATLAEQIVSQQLGGQDPGRTSYHQPTTPITVSSPIYHSLYGGP